MLNEFSQHITKELPFLKDKKLLIAISGGIDSVVLTHLFYELEYSISLAHCNFRLRGKESDGDEAFVEDLAKKLDIPVFIKKFDTLQFASEEKLSVQLAARKLRYDWFNELLHQKQYDYLLTAHHADDAVETYLINLSRGTGLDGLTGIPKQNGKIIRPLLPFSREQIEKYAKEQNIDWREDSTNEETKYLRNKIRHKIIPILKELNPNFLNGFSKTQDNLQGIRVIADDRIEEVSKDVISESADKSVIQFNIEKLKELSNPKAYLFEMLKKYGFTEWNDVENLLNTQSGKYVYSNSHKLLKDRGFLLLSKIIDSISEAVFFIEKDNLFLKTEKIALKITEIDKPISSLKALPSTSILIDKDLLKFPLIVRKWKEGDYFYPFGMKGKKKISKYFKDQKISNFEKENSWLLCSENDIVWVVGQRSDDRFKITDKTKHIVQIEILP
ncbi:MAG: tRNA lysidine(34) synthetase TilS [Flavobacteriaceae bacterium]|nr:tRNA lysidine(34) synthetase TilS [Flavobacteriaceae bacterium]